jgi:L-alanine-DL-glutamate epimerase-like enolase superfamily enzyme
MAIHSDPVVDRLEVSTFTVPTDAPESDGTLSWNRTTMVMVTAHAAGKAGLGYTYANKATAEMIASELRDAVQGASALAPQQAYMEMWKRIRNLGRPGICSMAISAVDCALWDLKARLLQLPLVTLLGQVREGATMYGSGGFTSYSDRQIAQQLSGWAEQGLGAVKMKIGREPERDPERVHTARKAIGDGVKLYVDANGAYSPREALTQMQALLKFDISWFEEPVSSDDLDGLHFVREHAQAQVRIAAGEYAYSPFYFLRMLSAGSVDVLQADITRCGGVTAFMQVAALCQAFNMPLSSHTAPMLHTHPACAAIAFTEGEYFHDHVRIERMFFDGLPALKDGKLHPDLARPGNGLELRRADAQKFAA